MLAYLFWHWPRPHADPRAYEESLAQFHHSLAANPSPGFRGSLAVRVAALPWLPAPSQAQGYEDWYLVDGSVALDPLNAAAVSGRRKAAHDRAAHAAAGGAGGLYGWQRGELDLSDARAAAWLDKPEGMSYAAFSALLHEWTAGARISLWQRQMVLGPAPEFCLLGLADLALPPRAAARVIPRYPLQCPT